MRDHVAGEDLGECPFCKGKIGYTFDKNTNEPTGMSHSLPPCPKFIVMRPDRFAEAARRALGIQDPS